VIQGLPRRHIRPSARKNHRRQGPEISGRVYRCQPALSACCSELAAWIGVHQDRTEPPLYLGGVHDLRAVIAISGLIYILEEDGQPLRERLFSIASRQGPSFFESIPGVETIGVQDERTFSSHPRYQPPFCAFDPCDLASGCRHRDRPPHPPRNRCRPFPTLASCVMPAQAVRPGHARTPAWADSGAANRNKKKKNKKKKKQKKKNDQSCSESDPMAGLRILAIHPPLD